MNPADPIAMGFAIAGTVSSYIMAFSPMPVMCKIVFTWKDVGKYRADPFIVGIVYGLVNGVYSLYAGHFVSFLSCAIASSLYIIYLVIYIYYAKTRVYVGRRLFIAVALAVSITGIGPLVYMLVHDQTNMFVSTWLGVCACITIVLLFSGQLTNIIQVIRDRDASSISVAMMCGGLFCSIMWTVYASLVMDLYFLTSNAIGIAAGLTQAFLLCKYPPNKKVIINTS